MIRKICSSIPHAMHQTPIYSYLGAHLSSNYRSTIKPHFCLSGPKVYIYTYIYAQFSFSPSPQFPAGIHVRPNALENDSKTYAQIARFTRLCVCVSLSYIFQRKSISYRLTNTHNLVEKICSDAVWEGDTAQEVLVAQMPSRRDTNICISRGVSSGSQYTRSTCATRFHILAAAFPIYILHSI